MSQKIYTDLDIKGNTTIGSIANATTDTDKFLVSDNGLVKYRTGAEMLSDLGVAPGVASNIQHQVKAGVAINKGQAVYVTSADGTNMIVGLASNTSEATSSKTMGLLASTVAINGFANVITEGLLAGLNTIGATAGDPVWLGTDGNLIYGLINKPSAPAHLVFIGIVTRVNASNGEIFVKVQNGFEFNEIHDVDLKTTTPVNGDILGFNGTLWVNKTIAAWLGYTPANASGTNATGNWGISITGNASTASSTTVVGVHSSNEVNLGGGYTGGGTLYVNYNDGGSYTNMSFYNGGTSLCQLTASQFNGALSGNATTATTLQTARTINGTSFNGSANITTANWGTGRTITIGATGKTVDGSGNVSWSLSEIGAYAATNPNGYTSNTGTVTSVSGTGSYGGLTLSGTVTGSGSLTLGGTPSGTWPISITGSSDTVDGYHASGLWKLNEWNGSIYGHTDGRIYGTIFYDSNDSAYYADPASNSNLNGVSARQYYQSLHGEPRNNLGDPTVTDMALFDAQFNNKTELYPASKIKFFTSADGTNYSEYTGFSDVQKQKLVTGDDNSGVFIPNGTNRFRIELDARGYVAVSMLYMYWSSNSHSSKVHIWFRRSDNQTWYQHTNSSTNVSSWPGHITLPFPSLWWLEGGNSSGHCDKIRIEFIPNWSGHPDYGTLPISLDRLQLWGGYPAGKRNIFHTNYAAEVTFPSNVYSSSGKLATETFVTSQGFLTSVPAQSWSSITGKPTTISGFGITDAITTSNIGSQSVNYASSAGSVAWGNVSGRPTNVSSFTNDSGYITGGYLSDFTSGNLRFIADYGSNTTWFIRSSGQFIFGNAHDWTQSFRLSLSHDSTDNGTWAYFGQQDSNATNGRYRGVRIRKYAGGTTTDGDLSAGAFYIGTTRKDTNWDTAYSWGNHASAGYLTSYTETDTLASITGRGATTSTLSTFDGGLNIGNAKLRWGGTTSPTLGFPFTGGPNGFWIDVNDGDTGGLAIDNDGTTIYGAGDSGHVFRVIDEDVYQATSNVDASTTFRIQQGQNGGGYLRGNFEITGTLTASGYNKTNWDTAFGWGNHAAAGYALANGTVNYIPKFTASGTIGNSLIYDNGTSVGIGTTALGARLDVRAQGALDTDMVFRVRNSTDTQNFLVVNGAGDVYNRGAQGVGANTFFGEYVGRTSTGGYNSAFGTYSLYSNTTGAYNIAVGYSSLTLNTLGSFNTAVGTAAMYSNTSGNNNIAIGHNSLTANTSGNSNTAVGYNALISNTTGINNTALGHSAGGYTSGSNSNQTSNNSVYLGYNTRPSASGNTNEIVIGADAIGNGSNTVTLGNDSITKTVLKGDVVDLTGESIYLKLITVNGNTTITNSFHNKIVRITASCTITIQAGLRTDFNCTFEVIGAYTAQFVDGSGATTSAPFGRYLKTDLTAMFYCTGTASNYRLNGSLATS